MRFSQDCHLERDEVVVLSILRDEVVVLSILRDEVVILSSLKRKRRRSKEGVVYLYRRTTRNQEYID